MLSNFFKRFRPVKRDPEIPAPLQVSNPASPASPKEESFFDVVKDFDLPTPPPPPAAPPTKKVDVFQLPEEIRVTAKMRCLPAVMTNPPKAWTVSVTRREKDSFWISRVETEKDPVPVKVGEMVTLVTFNDTHQNTYECKVLKIATGTPEQILVAAPAETKQEESRASSIGRRKHFRLEIRLPVDLKYDGVTIECHSRDLSLGGLALDLPRTLPEGIMVDLTVRSWNFPLKTPVKIIRCFELDGEYIAAVAFPPDMTIMARELVSHFLAENQRGR
jgi:c-di-GMP-binding flagellar brake protein YcgR